MAYEQYPSAWKAKESSVIVFSENELLTPESNYALCKVIFHTLNAWGYLLLKLKVLVHLIIVITSPDVFFFYHYNYYHCCMMVDEIQISAGKIASLITYNISFQFFLLQNVSFTSPFYLPPVILTTVLSDESNSTNKACPVKGPLSSWLEVKRT